MTTIVTVLIAVVVVALPVWALAVVVLDCRGEPDEDAEQAVERERAYVNLDGNHNHRRALQ